MIDLSLLSWGLVPLVGIASWQLSGWLNLSLYVTARPWIVRLAPTARSRLLLLIATVPAAVGIGVCAALFVAPDSILSPVHCHPGHGCGPHAPVLGSASLYLPAWALGLGLGALLALAVLLLGWISRGHRKTLAWMVSGRDPRGFGVLDTQLPVAVTAGMVSPGVYLSQGLIEKVSSEQLAVILAHEQAHVARRDNLRRALAAFLLPTAGRKGERLRRDLRVAAEESADQVCAHRIGNAHKVADTLLKVERLGQRAVHVNGCGFTDADLVQRVATLLRPPRYSRLEAFWSAALALLAGLHVLLTTRLVHYLIEGAVTLA